MERGTTPDKQTALKDAVAALQDVRRKFFEYSHLIDELVDSPARDKLLASIDELLADLDRALNK